MMAPIRAPLPVIDYTLEILALRKAIASGVLTASYEGKNVTYDDFAGMKQRLALVEGWQLANLYPGYKRPGAGFAVFNRGNR